MADREHQGPMLEVLGRDHDPHRPSFEYLHRLAHGQEEICDLAQSGKCHRMTGEGLPICHHRYEAPVPPREPYLTDSTGEPTCPECHRVLEEDRAEDELSALYDGGRLR